MSIGQRIKQIRNSHSMSQAAFASLIGISQGTLSEIEKGKFNPSVETVISISKQFEIKTDWILRGNELEESYNEELDSYKEYLLKRTYILINETISHFSEELQSEMSSREISSLINNTWTSIFNSSLSPEESFLLKKYRMLSLKDKKELQAIMNLKLSAYEV
ncbi:helix-turn-helix transcriptional regulator [Paenibacillus zanthoxyli]|uniref:helix-turn-helix transcriptional regulator n=1 Tax=Paenibacillus zanthoxyli TaxID=369399 RepID=UPI0004726983|nr:helix-turn-helix transcriptional regulator [Paenibacillus zanthoxyli]